MMKRGVVTRTRPAAGPHPATGDTSSSRRRWWSPTTDIDRLVSVTRDAVKAVLGV